MPLLILMVGMILSMSHLAFSSPLEDKIVNTMQKALPHSSFSIVVANANTTEKLINYRPNTMLYPASNIKLFTAAAAYYFWPKETHFFTQLLKKGNDYYLYFGGSPSLTSDDIDKLFTDLANHEIHTIKGNLIIDSSRFKPPYYNPGTSFDDLGWYYSAPNTAAIINENTEIYSLKTSKKPETLVTIEPKGKTHYLNLINQLKTVSIDKANKCSLNLESQTNNTIVLYGCAIRRKTPQEIKLAVPNPIELSKKIIAKSLEKQHVKLAGKIIDGTTPRDAQTLVTLNSPPLSTLVSHMLQESDNLYAETISRQLAVALKNHATTKGGALAIKNILSQNTPIDMKQLQIEDGVGTRYNMATTEQIVLLLKTIYKNKPLYQLFLKGLPQSSVSGTLKDRFLKTELEQRVFAKTGSMHDISALSGYLTTQDGQVFIFSILVNGINQPISQVRKIEEEILVDIAKVIDERYNNSPAFA